VVTGLIDLYTGGKGGKDPDEEANTQKRAGSVDSQQGVDHEEERQTDEGDGGSATL
jgi:hypothetical protein